MDVVILAYVESDRMNHSTEILYLAASKIASKIAVQKHVVFSTQEYENKTLAI